MQFLVARPLLSLLALAALVVLGVSMADAYKAAVQWKKFSACLARYAGPALGTPSGICASRRMQAQYNEMKRANCRNCDKYFHCRANYDAVHCKGRFAYRVAKVISDCREYSQPGKRSDRLADQAANRHGRSRKNCKIYLRPKKCYYRPRSRKCKR